MLLSSPVLLPTPVSSDQKAEKAKIIQKIPATILFKLDSSNIQILENTPGLEIQLCFHYLQKLEEIKAVLNCKIELNNKCLVQKNNIKDPADFNNIRSLITRYLFAKQEEIGKVAAREASGEIPQLKLTFEEVGGNGSLVKQISIEGLIKLETSTSDQFIACLQKPESKDFESFLNPAIIPPNELFNLLKWYENRSQDHKSISLIFMQRFLAEKGGKLISPYAEVSSQILKEIPECIALVKTVKMVERIYEGGAPFDPINLENPDDLDCRFVENTALMNLILYSRVPPALDVLEAIINRFHKLEHCKETDWINHSTPMGTALSLAQIKQKYNAEWKSIVDFLLKKGAKPLSELLLEDKTPNKSTVAEEDFDAKFNREPQRRILHYRYYLAIRQREFLTHQVTARVYGGFLRVIVSIKAGSHEDIFPFVCILAPKNNPQNPTPDELLTFTQNSNNQQKRSAIFFANGLMGLARELLCYQALPEEKYGLHVFSWGDLRSKSTKEMEWTTDKETELLKDIAGLYKKLCIVATRVVSECNPDYLFRVLNRSSEMRALKAETKSSNKNKSEISAKKVKSDEIIFAINEMDMVSGSRGGLAALKYAIEKESIKLFKKILTSSNFLKETTAHQELVQFVFAQKAFYFLKLLVKEYDFKFNFQGGFLIDAVERGDVISVTNLIELGANPWNVESCGKTPVLVALEKRSIELLKILLPEEKLLSQDHFENILPGFESKQVNKKIPEYRDIYQVVVSWVLTERDAHTRKTLLDLVAPMMPELKKCLPDEKMIADFYKKQAAGHPPLGFVLAVQIGHLDLIDYLLKKSIVFRKQDVFNPVSLECGTSECQALVLGLTEALRENEFDILNLLMKSLQSFPDQDIEETRNFVLCLDKFAMMAVEKYHADSKSHTWFLKFLEIKNIARILYEDENSGKLMKYIILKGSLDFIHHFLRNVSKDEAEEGLIKNSNHYSILLIRMLQEANSNDDVKKVLEKLNELIHLFIDFMPELKNVQTQLSKLAGNKETKVADIKKLLNELMKTKTSESKVDFNLHNWRPISKSVITRGGVATTVISRAALLAESLRQGLSIGTPSSNPMLPVIPQEVQQRPQSSPKNS